MDENWDGVVVGGGPAGLSAAVMLGRARRRVLVVDAGEPRNRFAAHMHGVLGHDGIDPAELTRRGRREAAGFGAEFLSGAVQRVDDAGAGVSVRLADSSTLSARALVVATGLRDDLPAVPGLAERWGTSVLHCPYCHGWEVRGQRLGVLITSPLGMHQAQLIRQWSDDLTVFTAGLGDADEAALARLRSRDITLVDSPVVEVLGDGPALSGVRTQDGTVVELDALFTAGVARPLDRFLAHLDLDRADTPMGSFLAVDPSGRTSHERIWAVGNVSNPGATVAVSMGAGSFAGGMVNMLLVGEDFDRAERATAPAGLAR